MPRTEEECEELAIADHAAVVGRLLLVWFMTGYDDSGEGSDDAVDWNAYHVQPAIVRVNPYDDPRHGLFHWVDEWLDPYWDIDVIKRPDDMPDLRSCFMFGHSYNRCDEPDEPTSLVVLPDDRPELLALVDNKDTPYSVVMDWIKENGLWDVTPLRKRKKAK